MRFLSSKQKRLSKFIFQGCFLIPISNFVKKFLPTKKQGFAKYAIISAVYNTEDYLKDFLNSIIKQRLKFENNIFLILVDDGSMDNSAQIIEKYRAKYPKNIFYLYKKNGGQASARNLGLEFLRAVKSGENKFLNLSLDETNAKALREVSWVSFADSDDMLDRNYLCAVDAFLKKHAKTDICMLAASLIFYRERMKIRYKDSHALNFKFKKSSKVLKNEDLNEYLQLHMNVFLSLEKVLQSGVKFDESLRPSFEDAKFINAFLLDHLSAQSAFLSGAKYYYRKRFLKNSSLDKTWQDKDYFLNTPKNGTLSLLQSALKKCGQIPLFVQNLALYHLFWQIKELINRPEKISFLSSSEQEKYLNLLDENFTLINTQTILNFTLCGIEPWQKLGIIACFKKEKLSAQKAFISVLDARKSELKISYFSAQKNEKCVLKINDKSVPLKELKTRTHSFLSRDFIYEKSFVFSLDFKSDLNLTAQNALKTRDFSQHAQYLAFLVDEKSVLLDFKISK